MDDFDLKIDAIPVTTQICTLKTKYTIEHYIPFCENDCEKCSAMKDNVCLVNKTKIDEVFALGICRPKKDEVENYLKLQKLREILQ